MWSIAINSGVPLVVAVVSIAFTYVFTKRKEHEAEWRKLKFDQYQELVISMSGVALTVPF